MTRSDSRKKPDKFGYVNNPSGSSTNESVAFDDATKPYLYDLYIDNHEKLADWKIDGVALL